MPELPEVETTLRGIKPHLVKQKIVKIEVRKDRLRWPIPDLNKILLGQKLKNITRRAKYLLFEFETGTLILHLGMSGRLALIKTPQPATKHDHVDLQFDNDICLRFNDPRRFGALLWTTNSQNHPLLKNIGPEPLTDVFNGTYLFQQAKNKKVAVKNFIMDSKIVAGVGNIYANEALFLAGIRPMRAAGKINLVEYRALAKAIKKILQNAIKKGGTTLKDFLHPSGKSGYFSLKLQVYGREKQLCLRCKTPLKSKRIGQRSTVYCVQCQK